MREQGTLEKIIDEPVRKARLTRKNRAIFSSRLSDKEAITRIAPTKGWVGLKLGELWDYRELLYFLIWRDVKVRYKQTALGAAWAVIQPFMTMVVFSVFFGQLARMPSDGLPYPLFTFSALVPWTFFANGIGKASTSVVGNANLVKKVYFPRLAIPIANVLSGFVDFVMAFVMLLGMMFYYHMPLTTRALWIPLLIVLAFVTSLGISLWLSAMNVQFRDVQYIVPFLVQIWLFATPVAYPSSLLKGPWRTLYALNPMVGVVEGFRWVLLSVGTAPGPMVLLSSAVALVVLVGGLFYFRKSESSFADIA
jgi:lipopolysaccharide transport system permease protein